MTATAQQKMAALSDLKRFANSYPGFFAVLADIADVGSTEQALAEAKSSLGDFRAARERERVEADAAIRTKHDAADQEIEGKHSVALQTARGIVEAANNEVAPLRAEIEKLTAAIKAAKLKIAGLDEAIGARTAEHDQARREFEATKAAHETLTAELVALKARIGL